MKTLSRERLGTMLVHAGKIDNDQLEKSLQIQNMLNWGLQNG